MNSSESILPALWTDALRLMENLGNDGGLMSGSIYDTAQVLRYFPPSNKRPAIDWLLEAQEDDGGWTTPEAPRARYMPTLATLLALHISEDARNSTLNAMNKGLQFLARNQDRDWTVLGNDLPGGVELILPRLVHEAREAGLPIQEAPYEGLERLGNHRRGLIRRLGRLAGTTATHVWEGWAEGPDEHLVDGSDTVGHSPAASALWWSLAGSAPDLHRTREQVATGLRRAAAATTADVPGVICSCWPITHFERAFSLYPFLLAGCLSPVGLANCPVPFQSAVHAQLGMLRSAMTSDGLGFSDWFLPDGDDTAVAIAVLAGAGHPVNCAVMSKFKSESDEHFCAWIGEIQSSPTVTAHGIHALSLANGDWSLKKYCDYLLRSRLPNGLWLGEKWNVSPIYTTSQVAIALFAAGAIRDGLSICSSLAAIQQLDGGWGMHESTSEETAYAILALLIARRTKTPSNEFTTALDRARQWMCAHYNPSGRNGAPLWLGKETYRPMRISRAFELAALIAVLQESTQ